MIIRILIVAGLAGLLCPALSAGSFAVSPVRVEWQVRKPSSMILVTNTGNEQATVQVRVLAWKGDRQGETYADSDDILVNPPVFTVAPGQKQTVRVGLRAPAALSDEGTYRLHFDEVPPPPNPGFTGIRTVLNLSIPIFIHPAVQAKPVLVWQLRREAPDRIVLSVENQGNAHAQVRRISLFANPYEPDFVKDVSTYVLPSGRAEWVFQDADLWKAATLKLQVRTDVGDFSAQLAATGP